MFVFFGAYTVTKVTGQHAQFYCPQCQGQSTFAYTHRQQYFHVFFVPMIPLQEEPAGLLCSSCRLHVSEAELGEIKAPQLATWPCPLCNRQWPETNIRCPICRVRPDGTPA